MIFEFDLRKKDEMIEWMDNDNNKATDQKKKKNQQTCIQNRQINAKMLKQQKDKQNDLQANSLQDDKSYNYKQRMIEQQN